LWKDFKKKLRSLGLPSNLFGIHSLRARGAITAVDAEAPGQPGS